MNYDEVIVNKDFKNGTDRATAQDIERIINKPGKLTKSDLKVIAGFFGLTLKDLVNEVRKTSQEKQSEYSESITVPLPMEIQPISKSKPKSKTKKKKRRSSNKKSPKKTVTYAKIKKIVNKKKIPKHEMKLLCWHYNIPIRKGIQGVWFAAAKKGHIYIMKCLHKKGHIDDVNLTNEKGITAQQIAEKNRRGHISKWLSSESTQKVDISKNSGYRHFKQTYSDSDDSDMSIGCD